MLWAFPVSGKEIWNFLFCHALINSWRRSECGSMYWSLDGKILGPGCVKSGAEIMPEEFGSFWMKMKAHI